jgi:hypothetical protein
VNLPGPSGVAWALELLLWAVAAAVVGEFVRALAIRRVPSWRDVEPVERMLLDFYLGGAAMYLAAALPIGAFTAPVVVGLPIAAGVGVLVLIREGHRGRVREDVGGTATSLLRPAAVVALLCGLALFVFELAVALPVATGNTYDSSLLTLYVSFLLQHHTVPLSFQPYASLGILYPQGTTVWLGWAQLDFGLPPARTSLLVTPLFLALAPLGAFVFGRRAFASDRAGVAFALMLTAVGSWTRVLVSGSNDFVFAFPLVLLLAGQSFAWFRGRVPSIAEAVAFGVLLGYSAALNPVGAQWLLPTLLVSGILVRPRSARTVLRWVGRWAVVAAASLVALLPTLYILFQGLDAPGLAPGATKSPAGTPIGITGAQFVGNIDPYLFRTSDVALSPLPLLRLELAVLLTVGIAILLLVRRQSALAHYVEPFRTFVAAGVVVIVGLTALLWAASSGFGPGVRFAEASNASQLSVWLFTLYTLVGGLLLVLLLERLAAHARGTPSSLSSANGRSLVKPRRSGLPRGTLSVLLVLLVVIPGAALTPTELPPVLDELYHDFGNVSAGDFALLSYAGTHLPSGARVLVAPGSAAEFLPGYAPGLVLLYPLVPNWEEVNASYSLIVNQLSNATLNSTGQAAMGTLSVDYVIVTGANTVLWPPFSAAPLLSDPMEFPLIFHEGDAYLFARSAG